jgi:formate hydrogenlyase subunit 3/multisubunit Na+/H+ antiporter MnhD subunit
MWRVAIAGASLVAVAYGAYLYVVYNSTVYWNYANSTHVYWVLQPVLYGITAMTALLGLVHGVRSMRSPGHASGRWLTALLVVLLTLTVWACLSTLSARAYPV